MEHNTIWLLQIIPVGIVVWSLNYCRTSKPERFVKTVYDLLENKSYYNFFKPPNSPLYRYLCIRFNYELKAAEKKQLEQIMKEQEEADNAAEMYNNLTSDMLTENPDVAKSALGKNRYN